MDPLEAELALSPEARLALGIGRVARAHVLLDNTLRAVHKTLTTPSLGAWLHSTISSTDRLAEDCKLMLRVALIDAPLMNAAVGALDAAKQANKTRNRVVHDMWMRDINTPDGSPTQWRASRVQRGNLNSTSDPEPRDLDFLTEARTEIQRATIRVNTLDFVLWDELPFFRDGSLGSPMTREENLAIMRGDFTLHPDGSYSAAGLD